jgi:hypothetical protein
MLRERSRWLARSTLSVFFHGLNQWESRSPRGRPRKTLSQRSAPSVFVGAPPDSSFLLIIQPDGRVKL